MTDEVIFDDGEWWIDELGREHSGTGLDSSFDTVFLSHLGQMKITSTATGLVVKWDTRKVAIGAIVGIVERLHSSRAAMNVTLQFLYFGWVEEAYTSAEQALDRILEIQECCQIEILHPTLMKEHQISGPDCRSSLIRRGYELWERTNGEFLRTETDQMSWYLQQVIMFRRDPKTGDLVYSWVGNHSTCNRVYGREWSEKILGTPSSKSSGPENDNYARRMGDVIDSVMRTGEPRYHHVRALMNTNDKLTWQSYERLLTRHTLHGGQPVVVLLSDLSQDISIPLAGRP